MVINETPIHKEGLEIHLKNLIGKTDPKPHETLLSELLETVSPVEFEKEAFPEFEQLMEKVEELKAYLERASPKDEDYSSKKSDLEVAKRKLNSFRLNEKHFLIISVEKVIQLAIERKWAICKSADFIYLFNGAYWKSIDKEAFQKFLGESSEKMGVGKYTAKYFQFREKLFKQFIASEYLPAPERPKNKVMINLQNGTFEIKGKEKTLKAFNSKDFIKYQLPFAYDPESIAPIFQTYLDKVLPEKDKQTVLCEFLGYVFLPHSQIKLEKALFLFGSGANGKSVLYEVIKALLGSHNTSDYSLQSLTNDTGYYRAELGDKLVNYASEISGNLDSTKFKLLASGEPMEARLPYGNPFIITDYAKLIFNTNQLPKEVEFNNAFFRRFIIIPFEVTIPENEQDKELHKKIIENELPGVFNWVLEGLNRLLEQKKFSESKAIDNALDHFRTESDTVKLFMEEFGYEPDPEKKILLKDLFSEYRNFAIEDGYRPLGKRNLKKRLEALGIHIQRESEGISVYISSNHN